MGNLQDKPVSHLPKKAPPIYVSRQFGLLIKVPTGLTICPLPSKWSGAEDGTVLFLEPPSACLDTHEGPSSTRRIAGFAPSITLRYRANAGRNDNYDGPIPAPRSSQEMARQYCAKPEVSTKFKLFDQPAVTCRSDLPGDKVRIVLMAVYGSGHNVLLVTLLTTQERLAKDENVLANVSAAITACKAAPDSKEEAPACPSGTAW